LDYKPAPAGGRRAEHLEQLGVEPNISNSWRRAEHLEQLDEHLEQLALNISNS
jgi:hypothetical protein